MRHLSSTASATMLLGSLAFASIAVAAPPGQANMNGNMSMSAPSGPAATPPANTMNNRDADDNANSNGRFATDRDKGRDRAEDRRADRDDQKTLPDVDERKADADDRSAGKETDDRSADRDTDNRAASPR